MTIDEILYADGRKYAEWWIANGGSLWGSSPFEDEAKDNGFSDRLAEEREARKNAEASK